MQPRGNFARLSPAFALTLLLSAYGFKCEPRHQVPEENAGDVTGDPGEAPHDGDANDGANGDGTHAPPVAGEGAPPMDDGTQAGDSGDDDATGDDGVAVCGTIAGLGCQDGEFCDYAAGDGCGIADGGGLCRTMPTFCTREYAPVCGCDGTTYSNACEAAAAGASVAQSGACGCQCDGPAPGAPNMKCQDGSVGGPVCAQHLDGTCGWEIRTCPAEDAACGGLLGLACKDGQYCHYAAGQGCGFADGTGVCRDIPGVCTQEEAPVCGCDGKTYGNACKAASAGTGIAETGECGQAGECDPSTCAGTPSRAPNVLCDDGTLGGPVCERDGAGVCTWTIRSCPDAGMRCGGFAGFACPSDAYYCDYAQGDGCGIADGLGACAIRPQACTQQYAPVCGCDGKTYGNACGAAAAGMSVAHDGEC